MRQDKQVICVLPCLHPFLINQFRFIPIGIFHFEIPFDVLFHVLSLFRLVKSRCGTYRKASRYSLQPQSRPATVDEMTPRIAGVEADDAEPAVARPDGFLNLLR